MNKIVHYAILPLSLLLLLGVFFYWGGAKDIWFCDEVYTYESANSAYPNDWTMLNEEDQWVSGDEVGQVLAADSASLNFRFIADKLYNDHVPLYFWLFRVVSLIFYGSWSKWIGLSLNLVFYLGLFLLVREVFCGWRKDHLAGTLLALALMLHPVMLSQLFTIRMYMMFSFFLAAFLILLKEENLYSKKGILLYAATALGMLTHYYFWVYILFASGLFSLGLLCTKKIKSFLRFAGLMLCALVTVSAVFPQWIRNLLTPGSKGEQSIYKIFDLSNLAGEISNAVQSVLEKIFVGQNVIVAVVLFAIVFALYASAKKTNGRFWMVLGATAFYIMFVGHTQPTIEGRYLYPAEGVLLFLVLWMLIVDLEFLLAKWRWAEALPKNLPCLAVGLLMVAAELCGTKAGNIDTLRFRDPSVKAAIEDLASAPWIVFTDDTEWEFHCSLYDFTIPELVKRVGLSSEGDYDQVAASADELVVYVDEEKKTIEECIEFIETSSQKENWNCEKIGNSYTKSIYLCTWDDAR